MSKPESSVIPIAKSGGATALNEKGTYLLFQCLVVSANTERQEMFARAATEAGWDAVTFSDAVAALAHRCRNFAQLAFVDLESDDSGSFYELLEQFASEKDFLTIACGSEGDMEQEIWVRQVGAWLYLPGVDDETQLSVLCDEARRLVERSHVLAKSTASGQVGYRQAR